MTRGDFERLNELAGSIATHLQHGRLEAAYEAIQAAGAQVRIDFAEPTGATRRLAEAADKIAEVRSLAPAYLDPAINSLRLWCVSDSAIARRPFNLPKAIRHQVDRATDPALLAADVRPDGLDSRQAVIRLRAALSSVLAPKTLGVVRDLRRLIAERFQGETAQRVVAAMDLTLDQIRLAYEEMGSETLTSARGRPAASHFQLAMLEELREWVEGAVVVARSGSVPPAFAPELDEGARLDMAIASWSRYSRPGSTVPDIPERLVHGSPAAGAVVRHIAAMATSARNRAIRAAKHPDQPVAPNFGPKQRVWLQRAGTAMAAAGESEHPEANALAAALGAAHEPNGVAVVAEAVARYLDVVPTPRAQRAGREH